MAMIMMMRMMIVVKSKQNEGGGRSARRRQGIPRGKVACHRVGGEHGSVHKGSNEDGDRGRWGCTV